MGTIIVIEEGLIPIMSDPSLLSVEYKDSEASPFEVAPKSKPNITKPPPSSVLAQARMFLANAESNSAPAVSIETKEDDEQEGGCIELNLGLVPLQNEEDK